MNEYSQCGAGEPFALRVIGNDMAPEFCDGNIVVVDPGGRVKHGCFFIAELADDTVLRQLRIANGKYYVHTTSAQSAWEEVEAQNILGVISQRAGRRRQQRKRYDL